MEEDKLNKSVYNRNVKVADLALRKYTEKQQLGLI